MESDVKKFLSLSSHSTFSWKYTFNMLLLSSRMLSRVRNRSLYPLAEESPCQNMYYLANHLHIVESDCSEMGAMAYFQELMANFQCGSRRYLHKAISGS